MVLGDVSAVDRAVDLSTSKDVREAAATNHTFGAAIAGANLPWERYNSKTVQRSVAAAMSAPDFTR